MRRETEGREKRKREGKGRRGREKTNQTKKSLGYIVKSLWAGKFRVGGRVCQLGIEGCFENLQARSALVCKICT